jgi:hypothetical protein
VHTCTRTHVHIYKIIHARTHVCTHANIHNSSASIVRVRGAGLRAASVCGVVVEGHRRPRVLWRCLPCAQATQRQNAPKIRITLEIHALRLHGKAKGDVSRQVLRAINMLQVSCLPQRLACANITPALMAENNRAEKVAYIPTQRLSARRMASLKDSLRVAWHHSKTLCASHGIAVHKAPAQAAPAFVCAHISGMILEEHAHTHMHAHTNTATFTLGL